MNGVTILNEFEVVTKTVFNWECFCWGALIGVIIGLVTAVIVAFEEWDWSSFFLSLIIFSTVFVLFIGFLGAAVLVREPVEYETHYEVSINEEVNMQEFMDNYEIIETRGSIYTVRRWKE